MWIASFDIGKKNFAFCIEEMEPSCLRNIENIPYRSRYEKDGTATTDFQHVLDDVCSQGHIVVVENVDLTFDCDDTKYLDPKIFINLTQLLDTYKDYWNQCSIFLIEQQMSFGRKNNTMALKLGQHCFSYFIFQYASFKTTIEFPSYHKTKVLGAPKKMSKYQRKKWAIECATNILIQRNEKNIIAKVQSKKKLDDMLDCVCQLQAFKYLCFVEGKVF